ncbi:hypothetical protein N7532_000094 [Penicillium argentinense]|uniref:Uncharacterized protein n=1 Tax=Penicillium argentinense TaxID=1131581 RepID=A0A9W9KMA8_9EURO|nr:uncharacterized protein N7532_000094 [Penicillium argentinense]KAJ5112049.1 hypothetical protein N7532_000094 [Penicillium argentinense]
MMPGGLKGVDSHLYAILHSFGLKVEVLPVLINNEEDYYNNQVSSNSTDDGKEPYEYHTPSLKVHARGNSLELDLRKTSATKETQLLSTTIGLSANANSKLAINYMTYGNDPSTAEMYSFAAIIATIHEFGKRRAGIEKAERHYLATI